MASVTRSLRPIVSSFATRSIRPLLSASKVSPAVRAFSVYRTVQAKKYSKDHDWVELSDDKKTATIGISDYAAHALGDVVYVELPTAGLDVAAGDTIGAVESVKSASDIVSPITCKIVEANSLLEEKPGAINKGPEDTGSAGGWVAKVEVGEVGVKDLEDLMSEEEYKKFSSD